MIDSSVKFKKINALAKRKAIDRGKEEEKEISNQTKQQKLS